MKTGLNESPVRSLWTARAIGSRERRNVCCSLSLSLMEGEERDTVFVRGLAAGTHHDELNEAFSDVGPVKEAFVVVEKNGPNKGKSRGFGFVQFALSEDAVAAVEQLQGKPLGGGKLILALAEKKGYKHEKGSQAKGAHVRGTVGTKNKRVNNQSATSKFFHELAQTSSVVRKKANDSDDDQSSDESSSSSNEDSDGDDEENSSNNGESKAPKPAETGSSLKKTENLLRESSVVFYNLPEGISENQIRKKAGKAGKINLVQLPFDSGDQLESHIRSCMVVYTKRTSAKNAATKLNQKEWSSFAVSSSNKNRKKGKEEPKPSVSTVFCRRLIQVACNKRTRDRCRLIVRNLWFKATEEALTKAFGEFGPILRISIARKEGEEARGFAFVQFACRVDAQNAMNKLNGTKIGPRPVAIDWALDKKEYERTLKKEKTNTKKEDRDGNEQDAKKDSENESLDENETKDQNSDSPESDDDDDDDDNDNEEEEEEDEKDDESGDESDTEKPPQNNKSELNLTLFVRNILFETTEEELFQAFKKYGPVRYVKIAKLKDGRSRGTGFVNFYRQKSFEKALEAAEQLPVLVNKSSRKPQSSNERGGNGITCAGRPLLVTPAIDRSSAKESEEQNSKKVRQDKRHLYLIKEGLIHAASDVEVPKGDLQKRERAEKEKRTKLKNPLFFVSPLRLSVRNLFRGAKDGSQSAVDETQLKKAFLNAAIEGVRQGLVNEISGDETLFPPGWPDKSRLPNPKVIKARLIRDEVALPEESGGKKMAKAGPSKGYGFVEFSQHVHALAALRVLNNNPEYAHLAAGGPASKAAPVKQRARLIVEFSVENKAKLRQLEQRANKLKEKTKLSQNKQLAQAFAEKQKRAMQQDGGAPRKKQQMSHSDENGDAALDDQATKKVGGKRKKDHAQSPLEGKKKKQKPSKPSKPNQPKVEQAEYRKLVEQYKQQMFKEAKSQQDGAVHQDTDPQSKGKKRWFETEN